MQWQREPGVLGVRRAREPGCIIITEDAVAVYPSHLMNGYPFTGKIDAWFSRDSIQLGILRKCQYADEGCKGSCNRSQERWQKYKTDCCDVEGLTADHTKLV